MAESEIPADNDAVISIIAEAIASKTFGYRMAGNGSRARRVMRPVACEVLIRLHECGFVVANAAAIRGQQVALDGLSSEAYVRRDRDEWGR